MSRRRALLGIEQMQPPPIGTLLVDCPLNGDGLDTSGNNNHLTAGNQIQWATVEGRQVFYSPVNINSYFDLAYPLQGSYINNCRIEVEICRYSNTGSQAVFLDGCGANGSNNGLYNQTQHISNPTYFQLGFVNNGVIFDWSPLSSLIIGNWYKLIFQKKNADVYLAIFDIANNIFLGEFTGAMIANLVPSYNFIRIGGMITSVVRNAQGFIRNFKLYTNLI